MHTGILKLSIAAAPLRDATSRSRPRGQNRRTRRWCGNRIGLAGRHRVRRPIVATSRGCVRWRFCWSCSPTRKSGSFRGIRRSRRLLVLSGFLITSSVARGGPRQRHGVAGQVLSPRARRLLPAAALTLLVTDIAAFFLLNFIRAGEAVHDSLHAAAFAANFRFAANQVDYFAGRNRSHRFSTTGRSRSRSSSTSSGHCFSRSRSSASLSRGVTVGGRRHERRLLGAVVVLAGASLAWSVYATATLPEAAYYSPFTRAWELGMGAGSRLRRGVARVPRSPEPAWMGRDRGDRLRGGRVLQEHAVPGLRGARAHVAPPS